MNKIVSFLLVFVLTTNVFNIKAQEQAKPADTIFTHTIERGQTVYSIATMYGVTVDDIYRLNPDSRQSIKAGSTLRIPQRESLPATSQAPAQEEGYIYHTIQSKETLYSLSIRYEVPAEFILESNPGLSVATFQIGKTIRIPTASPNIMPQSEFTTSTKIVDYKIPKRETLYNLSRMFGIPSDELIRMNPQLKEGVKEGMVIKVPIITDVPVQQQAAAPRERDVNALLNKPRVIDRVNMVKIALLLPFMTNEPTPSATTARFIEYYEGMLLAVDSLRNQGCSIELSVFDTGEGTANLNNILKEDVLKEANLIIGAVQNDQIAQIAAFAKEQNIKYVIPFTSRNDDVLNNSNIFQVNTPHSYLYSKAAQAGCNLFSSDNIILLNVDEKDEKGEFIQTFKTELDGRRIDYKELIYNTATFQANIESMLDNTRKNVIVPNSGTQEALSKFSSTLRGIMESNPDFANSITLFGYPEWQTYRELQEDLYALDTYIYSNFYADNLSNAVSKFYVKYKTWFSKMPINTYPKYGILGFDTGMYFINAIHTNGVNFEENLDKIKYKSIQTGFNFERVNNWGGFINTNIFIVHYNQADFSITRSEVK